jgi:hypothetical protein
MPKRIKKCQSKPAEKKSSKKPQGALSENLKVLKWPSERRVRGTRFFTVGSPQGEKARRDNERARIEFHKFWTDCPYC